MQFSRHLLSAANAANAAGPSFLGRTVVQARAASVVFATKGAPALPAFIPHAVSTNSAKASSEFGTLLSGKSLGADLGFDSLMRKSLLSNLSAEFCVPIAPEDAENMLNFDSIVNYFSTHPKAR